MLLTADLRVHGRAALCVPFGKPGAFQRLCQCLVLLRRTGEHGEIVADGGAEDEGLLGQQRDLPAEIRVPSSRDRFRRSIKKRYWYSGGTSPSSARLSKRVN